MPRRPAPKSVKRSRIITRRSGSSSDYERPGPVVDKSRPVNISEFRTPERDSNATDYGLEFTNNMQAAEPHSTLRSSRIQFSREDIASNRNSSGKENRSPPSTSVKQAQGKGPRQQGLREVPNTNTENRPRVRRRKQRNPVQREKRFWNEVQKLQMRVDHLIPMLPFSRLVREIMMHSSSEVTRITSKAMEALQTSSEMYLTQRLQDAYLLTLHRQRATLEVRDMQLVKYLRTD